MSATNPLSPAEALRRAGEALIAAAQALEAGAANDDGAGVTREELLAAEAGPRIPHEAIEAMMEGDHPVKALRLARQLTQADLAKMVGSSAMYISQIERGSRRPSRTLLRLLARALATTPDVLDPPAQSDDAA